MTSKFKRYIHIFNEHEHCLAWMLLSLHALLVLGEQYQLYRGLFLCHFGLFLLWQPFLRQHNTLSWQAIILLVLSAGLLTYFMNWWVVAFWVTGLFSLIGGRVFGDQSQQSTLPNVIASGYLIAVLLLSILPNLMVARGDLSAANFLAVYMLPALPFTMLVLASKNKRSAHVPNIDFFYTLLIFLLTLVVMLGSFAIDTIWRFDYVKLLFIVIFSLTVALIAISWFWNPSASFSGLELLMSRYLLSLGLPFELWVSKIAALSQTNQKSAQFLEASVVEFSTLDWVQGVHYAVSNQSHQLGATSAFTSRFNFNALQLTVYSRWQLSPAMFLHVQLLTQILNEFYEAKRREEMIVQNAYIQSLYETGSRLTHDIKNILQSLSTLSSAVLHANHPDDDAQLIALMQKQLPRLNKRISNTLNKLEQPNTHKHQQVLLSKWWSEFSQHHPKIHFESPAIIAEVSIDVEVVESVTDNLIQNALEKIKHETEAGIKVCLVNRPYFCLEVSDTGAAIPTDIARQLFKSHISGSQGMGVGLYHAAQQASQAGYQLSLVDNQAGLVRFRLEYKT